MYIRTIAIALLVGFLAVSLHATTPAAEIEVTVDQLHPKAIKVGSGKTYGDTMLAIASEKGLVVVDTGTTLQGLLAMADNCNSLHTNAYDEAITTPTTESVRRAVAIQLINAMEFGLLKNENPLQGSHIVEWLTDTVEEAVLEEFERLSERGDVLGAMEAMYQRGKIQEESLHYERMKHTGEHPLVGVNMFIAEDGEEVPEPELTRATKEEKDARLAHLEDFHKRQFERAPAALSELQAVARDGGNIFEELLTTVRYCSLGQISNALYEVGGQYRRSM